jgi:hypothetical protein
MNDTKARRQSAACFRLGRRVFPAVLAAMLAGLILALAAACASTASPPQDTGSGKRFVLELSPGETYRTTTRWFIFEIPIYPQVAAWVETPDGRYLGTIYVTAKAEKQGWVSAPKEGRPEALPVWNHLRQAVPDAVAAATAEGATLKGSDLAASLPAGNYVIKLETNRSYDYNATYTTANAGVAGQPSLVYRAELAIGAGPASAVFQPIGTGSLDGSDGLVHEGLTGIDSALKLFAAMAVSYRE